MTTHNTHTGPDSDNVMPTECGQVYTITVTVDPDGSDGEDATLGPRIMHYLMRHAAIASAHVTLSDVCGAQGITGAYDDKTFRMTIHKVERHPGYAHVDDRDLDRDPETLIDVYTERDES